MSEHIYIVGAARTPIGSFGSSLASVRAPELGSIAIKSALERSGMPTTAVDEVLMGSVISAGLGQNPARQASLAAGLSESVGATTINKVCGSGLKTVMLAAQSVALGEADVVVAGGMESMSGAPYLLQQARTGYRLGNGELVDAMIYDGLWDVYNNQHMGHFGDLCASKFGFTREQQDDFAVRSYTRALAAMQDGIFAQEIVAVGVVTKKETIVVSEDEEPQRFDEDKLRSLKPAFSGEGTITAGNASSINDGAAAVVMASESRCREQDVAPLARIVGSATCSQEPQWFTTAPIAAIEKLLAKLDWNVDDVDLFEINEAFAVVAMAAQQELKIPEEKLNIHGGAVALGHPIGASGTRILVTLLNAMQQRTAKRGIAALCIGGGEAVALAVEGLR